MNKKDTISVIVPVYKVEAYLPKCLDSIVNQTYQNLEIILVDDGSPDNCGIICDKYSQNDSRITVIHKENQGMNAARNDGLKIATGEWIAFVDSDDWCELNYYEKLIQSCGEKKYDIVLSAGRFLEYEKKSKLEMHFSNEFEFLEKSQIDTLIGAITIYGCPWDRIFHADFIKRNGLCFDVTCKTFEDIWFNYQAFNKASSVRGCSFAGYHNRVTSTSATRAYNANKIKETYEVVCKMYDYAKENHFKEDSDAMIAIDKVAIIAISSSMLAYYFNVKNEKPYSEIVKEIKEIKQLPHIKKAIWSVDNRYMTKRHLLLKYFLRFPFIWPIRCLYAVGRLIRG